MPSAVLGDGSTSADATHNIGDLNNDNILQNTETWKYTLTTTPPAGDAFGGSHTNTVTATGTDDENNTVSSTATATITYTDVAPAIHVTKSANPTSVREGGVG